MKRQLLLYIHRGAITDVQFRDGYIYSASADSTIAITQLEPPQFISRVCSPSPINTFYLSRSQDTFINLIIGGDEYLSIYDNSFKQIAQCHINCNVTSLAFAAQKYLIFAACDDGAVRVYDVSLQELTVMRGHIGPVFAVQTNAQAVFTSGSDGKIIKWDFYGTAQKTACFYQAIFDLCISQNGRFMAACKKDGQVLILDIENGFKVVYRVNLACSQRFLQRVKMGVVQDKQSIICGDLEKVKYFDVKTQSLREVSDVEVESTVVYGLAVSGGKLAFGGQDGRIGIYQIV